MGRWVIGLFAAVALALPAGAAAEDAAFYCQGSPDNGASGAFTDSEHTVLVGDPKLPAGARQRKLTVDGVATTVTEAGRRNAKRAIVFAHGSPNYSRDFDHLLARASRYGRVISFDWPGYGHADDRPGVPYDVDGAAHFFGGLMDRLGVRRVDLVMHDFGGPWSLQWATRHSDALHSVVIVDSGVLIGYLGHPAALQFVTPGVGEATMATMTRDSFIDSIQMQNPKLLPSAFVNRMYDFWDRGTRCAALHYYRDMRDRTPDGLGRAQAAVLSKRKRPALVVWGENDPYIPVEVAYRQAQAFPGAQVHVVKDAGHWPWVDNRADVDSVVLPFLRRVSGCAARARPAPGRAARRSSRRPTRCGS
jgi:pimeloyl-ACP methyl ester carboxylesterase